MTAVSLKAPNVTRFCKDCKWVRDKEKDPEYWKCTSPRNVKVVSNLLTGETTRTPRYDYCETFREHTGDDFCGPEGSWWESV